MCHWSPQVALGQYPEQHFNEEIPRKLMEDFQANLQQLSGEIKSRNADLEIPYTYLDPANLENSVAIWPEPQLQICMYMRTTGGIERGMVRVNRLRTSLNSSRAKQSNAEFWLFALLMPSCQYLDPKILSRWYLYFFLFASAQAVLQSPGNRSMN